jgi:hypothetical protein
MSTPVAYVAIHTEGGLLPVDLLNRVAAGESTVRGLKEADYHLAPGERLSEQIARAWSRLLPAWRRFAAELDSLQEGDPAAGATRERWLQPLFHELGQGRLLPTKALDVEGKSYAISHLWGQIPIHLVGVGTSLDRRQPGVRGAATASPHSMVQELLNRSNDYLWAVVSNGRQFRVLRDNVSLTRQAYLEFDLETIFANEIYGEFVLLWLMCHESRFDAEKPAESWLERWVAEAASTGTRALDALRDQVELAITRLGHGFLAYPDNHGLRARVRGGQLSTVDYYRQLLRLIYRLIFLFVAEDRAVLFDPDSEEKAQHTYIDFYSLARLRGIAAGRSGRGPHPDLWRSLLVVMRGISSPEGCVELALPALGSFLWSEHTIPDLDSADISNTDLLAAMRALTLIIDRDARLLRPIDYRNLGADELGGIYEGLLELHPVVDADAGHFELEARAGSERKSTGSYYTPDSLIAALLDSALDPLLDEAARATDPEEAILSLRVLDPAAGSGHFLAAAGRRIARRLAAVRTRESEPAPEAVRHAVRDVVGRCLYGIYINPMALELAKISLWLEAIEPGRPLSFLDHHLACGNALLGATPELVAGPIPDEAYRALTDDDKATATKWRKTNAAEAKKLGAGHGQLALGTPVEQLVAGLGERAHHVEQMPDATPDDVDAKAAAYLALADSIEMSRARTVADAWCAAFFVPKRPGLHPVTTSTVATLSERAVEPAVLAAIDEVRARHGLLHWHLAFPDVFASGGFSLVVGNPPWEKVKLSEREFFASRDPEVAQSTGAKRKALIAELETEDPTLWLEFRAALRAAEAESAFLHTCGRFPLCGRGDVNTYAVFVEAMRDGLAPNGRLGVIVPTGIAADDTTKTFFADCVSHRRLISLFDFENRLGLFPDVDSRMKFCLLTLSGPAGGSDEATFAFYAHTTSDLADPERRFTLTPEDLALINPNTRTAPVFRSTRDAELTKKIYRHVPVLVREGTPDGNQWGVDFSTMFHMTNDSNLFRTAGELAELGAELDGNVWRKGSEEWLPLYEPRMVHQFNHRWGDFSLHAAGSADTQLPNIPDSRLADPSYAVQPRYWTDASEVRKRLSRPAEWLLGVRSITNTTNERTMIATALPVSAVGNNELLLFTITPGRHTCLLTALLNSFVFDYCTRQKLGHAAINIFVAKQLPVLPPSAIKEPAPWTPGETVCDWMVRRVLELTYTAVDLAGFAADLGYQGPPFRWDPDRRRELRAELDAACFHLYGLDQEEAAYVMDTFPIVCRRDEATYGEYLTKRIVMEQYDILAS